MIKNLTIKQLREEFSNEDKCLDAIFYERYKGICKICKSTNSYKRIINRRCYQCTKCRHQIYPTKGTPLERTTTPLSYWFFAMFLFVNSKNGLGATELQRHLGVTYKTSWRMLMQLRKLIKGNNDFFSDGIMELDETYIGGKNKNRHFNEGINNFV